jgi:phosphatidylinositol-bisphosphatase
LNHDFVFWIGDLNYRINDDLSTEEVFQCAERGNLMELRQHDQLNIERKRGAVLHGFEEGALNFRPTYKFQAGTSVYEKRPEKKLRAPAWCDRILWKARDPEDVVLHSYDCVMGLDLSDHKPVHAGFEIQVRHQVDTKKNQVMREIMIQLDKWENENMPKVQLLQSDGVATSSGVLGFSHLKFGIDQSKTLIVENTGIVVAHFRFIPKLDEVVICKPWLRVSPMFGMIPPKERVEIRITGHVDDVVAHGLTSGGETLDDTMILRIENGRDYFIVVSGQYDNSCFGNSLEQLVSCTDPVRHVKFLPSGSTPAASMFSVWACGNPSAFSAPEQQQAVESATGAPATPNGNNTMQKVPKELWRMVNDIYQNFMQEKNLFVEAGNEFELAQLREALDTGQKFPTHSGYSTAELLLTWLQSLRQSVVPDEILTAAIANGNGDLTASCRALLEMLPPVRYNVVIYLVSFLREVLKHAEINKLSAEKLAFVFSRSLVSPCRLGRMDSALSVIQTTPAAGSAGTAVTKQQQQQTSQSSQAPGSSSSTASTTSGASAPASSSSLLLPEERVRRNARDMETAQWNAAQRAERMEAILLHLLSTPAL